MHDENGLIYLRARYYNPKYGSFINNAQNMSEQQVKNYLKNDTDNLIKSENNTIEDILKNKQYTNSTNKISNYNSTTKGFDVAKTDFYKLNPTDIKEYSNGTFVGKLKDGSTINVRSFSGNSRGNVPTIEIQTISGKNIKIRY